MVDKYGIMSTGLPCSLPDDDTIQMLKIKTCWPPRMRDFANVSSLFWSLSNLFTHLALRFRTPLRKMNWSL